MGADQGGPALSAGAVPDGSAEAALRNARAEVGRHTFATPEWEASMRIVRHLADAVNAARPPEPFCSIDSGQHPTRRLDGRII